MTELSDHSDLPQWSIEMQPSAENLAAALIIVGDAGTVTIPLNEAGQFFQEWMVATTRLAAIEAEVEDRRG